jgi:hypothetical protein
MAEKESTSIVAFAVWIAIQLMALGLSASRVALSARYPADGERLSLAVMLVAQTGATALLFPILLKSMRWTFAAILIAWPMGQIASLLADESIAHFVLSEAYVSIWMLTLFIWTRALQALSACLYATAIAALITIGGPVLWYLRGEFVHESSVIDWKTAGALGPMMGALSQNFSPRPISAWGMLAILLLCGALGWFWKCVQRSNVKTGKDSVGENV